MRKNPAELVIKTWGGVRKTARALEMSPATVSRWQRLGGLIPSKHLVKILERAKESGLDLKPEDLIYGRDVA